MLGVHTNSSTDIWCWTVEHRCDVEQLKRYVLLNNLTEICWWTVDRKCAGEQIREQNRDVLLDSWRETRCWTGAKRCAVEQINKVVLLNNLIEMWRWTDQHMCCWRAEQSSHVEQLKRYVLCCWTITKDNRDVTMNRSSDVINSWTVMCCWTVEKRRNFEQMNRHVLLNRSTETCCWTVDQRYVVE